MNQFVSMLGFLAAAILAGTGVFLIWLSVNIFKIIFKS
jgi:hypothetical protein